MHIHGNSNLHVYACIFIKKAPHGTITAVAATDDVLIANLNENMISRFTVITSSKYKVRDLGSPSKYLGVSIIRIGFGHIHIYQPTLIAKALNKVGLQIENRCWSFHHPHFQNIPHYITRKTERLSQTKKNISTYPSFATLSIYQISLAMKYYFQHPTLHDISSSRRNPALDYSNTLSNTSSHYLHTAIITPTKIQINHCNLTQMQTSPKVTIASAPQASKVYVTARSLIAAPKFNQQLLSEHAKMSTLR